jgi:hypothetical protein
MYHKDSPTQREEERRGYQSAVGERAAIGALPEEERSADTISRPGGFRNDPDVPTNPNEARERYLRKIRSFRLF